MSGGQEPRWHECQAVVEGFGGHDGGRKVCTNTIGILRPIALPEQGNSTVFFFSRRIIRLELSFLRKEKIRLGLIRKRERETKALAVVTSLLEKDIDREGFRKVVSSSPSGMVFFRFVFLLPFVIRIRRIQADSLNDSYYDDVTEERSCCGKLCGYPLCDREIENVPKQQYRISTRHNKVFDITKRKVSTSIIQ